MDNKEDADKNEGKDNSTMSSQVLEYYKNYSQSKLLPRYFCGDYRGVSPNPPDKQLLVDKVPEVVVENVEEPIRNPSPASSVTSNRKLEWDNGADIGYENYELHKTLQKSHSLPLLTAHLNQDPGNKINSSTQTLIIKQSCSGSEIEKYTTSSSDPTIEKVAKYISSSSSSYCQDTAAKNVALTTTDTSDDDLVKPPSSKEILKLIKQKVGSPVAESTIVTHNFTQSPLINEAAINQAKVFHIISECSDSSTSKPNIMKYASKYRNKNTINLCISKPVVVECVNYNVTPGLDKVVQTSLVKNAVKAVQTETDCVEVINVEPTSSRHSVLYIKHTDSEKDSEILQSDSDVVVSNCNSFEYLYGDECDEKLKQNALIQDCAINNLKRSKVKTDLTNVTSSETSGSKKNSKSTSSKSSESASKSSPLGKLISKKQSDNLIEDVDKSICLLQMLMKSKKYDKVTKKYYIKKIMQKILDSKYIDDISEQTHDETKMEFHKKLQDNVPWVPARSTSQENELIVPTETSRRQLDIHTFCNEFVPTSRLKRSRFTLPTTSQEKSSTSTSSINELYHLPKKYLIPEQSTSETSSENQLQSSKSWKEEKTKSEILLEKNNFQRQHESGDFKRQPDHLVHFARKEREHQLTWISNEITHLNKLKNLLEKHNSKGNVLNSIFKKPYVQDMKGIKKSTTVYMITTEKSENSRMPCYNSSTYTTASSSARTQSNQDYVVHANLDSNGRNEEVNFRLVNEMGNKNYKFRECYKYTSPGSHDEVSGNVEVLSDDQQTNIKVNAQLSPKRVEETSPRMTITKTTTPDTATFHIQQSSASHPPSTSRFTANTFPPGAYPKSKPSCSKHSTLIEQPVVEDAIKKQIGAPFDLQNARLVSNQVCKSAEGGARTSSVRRFTFEIPISSNENIENNAAVSRPVNEILKRVNTFSASSLSKTSSGESSIIKSKAEASTKLLATKVSCSSAFSYATDNQMKPNEILSRKSNSFVQTENIPQHVKYTDGCPCYKSDCFAQTESVIQHDKWIDNCISSEDKTSQTKTAQLKDVSTDTVGNMKHKGSLTRNYSKDETVQVPSFRKASTSTQIGDEDSFRFGVRKETTYDNQSAPNKNYSDDTTTHKFTQTSPVNMATESDKNSNKNTRTSSKHARASTSTISNSSSEIVTTTTDESTSGRCACCKRKKITSSSDSMPQKVDGISPNYILCHPCYAYSRTLNCNNQPVPYYMQPGHVCNCYSIVQNETMQQIRKTVQDLDRLNSVEEYCKCNNGKKKSDSEYCSNCKCKLQKSSKSAKGVAYVLTFEAEKIEKSQHKHKHHKQRSLEEITVKIPSYSRKKHKDKENMKMTLEKASHEEASNSDSFHEKDKHHKPRKQEKKKQTLQECLLKNRPNFIESAEERRKCMIDLAYMREQRCQKYKQLLALTSGLPVQQTAESNKSNSRRVFTSKEMKQITEKNYKKLPEVQQKLLDNRERQIKKANRILADIFNKKLRENVLKGKRSLSTSVSVINLA